MGGHTLPRLSVCGIRGHVIMMSQCIIGVSRRPVKEGFLIMVDRQGVFTFCL